MSLPQGHKPTLKERLKKFETLIIRDALARHKGNRVHVARELGIKRNTLQHKLKTLGLVPEFPPKRGPKK